MKIDWITVTAQIVNFLVLVFLLKRFLYQPVIDAMTRREQRIAQRFQEAQQREQEAQQAAQRFQQQSEELESNRNQRLAAAEAEAAAQGRQLLDRARQGVEADRLKWQQQLQREKQHFLDSLRKQTAEAISDVARRTLADLADAELEKQVVEVFLKRLRTLDAATRKTLAGARESFMVTTAFDLDEISRAHITETLTAAGATAPVRFTRSPEPVCGIEVRGQGFKLAWTVADYLKDLEQRLDQTLMASEAS